MDVTDTAHEHNFEFEEWSYNDERRYRVCDCGAKVPDERAGERRD